MTNNNNVECRPNWWTNDEIVWHWWWQWRTILWI